MNRLIQRIQSHLATPAQAQEKVSDLLVELRHRGIKFEVKEVNDEGEHYFYAKSIGYPRGQFLLPAKLKKSLHL